MLVQPLSMIMEVIAVSSSVVSVLYPELSLLWISYQNSPSFIHSFIHSFVYSFILFRATPMHMEVSRLGVKLELQLLACTTATAMPDPNYICDLYHILQQCWILNSLSEAGDGTCILTHAGWFLNSLSHSGNSLPSFYLFFIF